MHFFKSKSQLTIHELNSFRNKTIPTHKQKLSSIKLFSLNKTVKSQSTETKEGYFSRLSLSSLDTMPYTPHRKVHIKIMKLSKTKPIHKYFPFSPKINSFPFPKEKSYKMIFERMDKNKTQPHETMLQEHFLSKQFTIRTLFSRNKNDYLPRKTSYPSLTVKSKKNTKQVTTNHYRISKLNKVARLSKIFANNNEFGQMFTNRESSTFITSGTHHIISKDSLSERNKEIIDHNLRACLDCVKPLINKTISVDNLISPKKKYKSYKVLPILKTSRTYTRLNLIHKRIFELFKTDRPGIKSNWL